MDAFELVSQNMQFDVPDSEPFQFLHRCEHVIAATARSAMALAGKVQLLGEAEPPGILAVAAIDDIAKGMHTFLRVVIEPDPSPSFAIHLSDLLTSAQVFDCFRSLARRDPVSDTTAISAAIEAEYQAGFFRGSTVNERVDAKGPMGAHQARVASIQKVKARPPHQRTIGEDPELLVALIGAYVHRGGNGPRHNGPATRSRNRRPVPAQPAATSGVETPHSKGF
jgi:hypothetical protein